MSSISSKVVSIIARYSGISSCFDKKIETGKDTIAAKCPIPNANSGITLIQKQFVGRPVYYFEAANNKSKNHILYFHGGAFLTNFSLFHWRFLQDMVKKTGCSLTTPDYPLAPEYYYKDVFAMVFPLYMETVEKYGAENIILMGDSAGGGLSLAIAQLAKKEGAPTPQQIIMISPWLDLTCSSPANIELENNDPMLLKSTMMKAAQVYARGNDLSNHLLSPINGTINDIGEISVFTGTYDVLNAEAKILRQKAEDENVKINYVEGEKMIHIWPIIGITPEAKKARNEIYKLLITNKINK